MLTTAALEAALQLIIDNWPYDHGHYQVGYTWQLLDKAIRTRTGMPPKAAPVDTGTWELRWGHFLNIRAARSRSEYNALVARRSHMVAYAATVNDSRSVSIAQEIELLNSAIDSSGNFKAD